MHTFRMVKDESELEAVLGSECAVIFKHSPVCPISARAHDEMTKFAQANPAIPVYIIDVASQVSLSERIGNRLQTHHESPPAIIVRNGVVVWEGSHFDVSQDDVECGLSENGS